MPKEYIEREALIEQINCAGGQFVYGDYVPAIISRIKQVPTADVVEVKHGEWKRREDYEMYWYECSNCGVEPLKNPMSNADFLSDYCPYCGAKMDRKDK